jgi:hypothetical protein
MRTNTISALAAVLALSCFGTAALAQDDGLPDNPNSNANTIPGPDATTPSDPAADDNPAARVPTTENEGYEMRREGSGRGTSGEGMRKEEQDDD